MYVDEAVLRDFRAIAASRVPFVHPGAAEAARLGTANVNLVVGTNGSGKSSVLKAVAAALVAARGGEGELAESVAGWPRIGGTDDALVQLRLSSPAEVTDLGPRVSLRVRREDGTSERQVDGGTRAAVDVGFVAAYGSSRGPDDFRPADGFDGDGLRPHLLFADTALYPIEPWLSGTSHRTEAAVLLDALLPEDVRCLGEPDPQGRVFAQRGIPLRVSDLSDGIQSFLAWMGDLLWRLDEATATDGGDLADITGVVLVDEIDQRLHPQWQQTFLTRLGSTFPALQFICTAHSPLMPSGLERENLLLVEPDPELRAEGATRTQRLQQEDVYGRTADQVLESSYFGMASSRSEPFWQELRQLAARARSRTTGQEAALEFMRRLADPDLRRRDRRDREDRP